MKKYAYQAMSRPNEQLNLREAATKPFMGITAFLRYNEPWLVVGFDGKNHILKSRDGSTVKVNTPFSWVEATDKSRLVAATCAEGSTIPGTPHFSFDENEWYLRIEDNIYDIEDIIDEFGKTADFVPPGHGESVRPGENPTEDTEVDTEWYPEWAGPEQTPPVAPENAGSITSPTELPGLEGPFTYPSGMVLYYDPAQGAYYDRNSDMYLPRDYDPNAPRTSHQVQEEKSRKDEKTKKPQRCPECDSHTKGNRIAEFDQEGSAIFHCKSCGHKYKSEGTIVNPKLTYQVDDEGKGNYAPGPDDENKVGNCSCGYSWKENHKFQTGNKSCPGCGKTVEREEQEVGAPGNSWKNTATFENATQDSMSGHDTGMPIASNPTDYRSTDITNSEMNVTAPAGPLNVQPSNQIDITTLPPELQNAINQHLQMAASLKESSTKVARKAFSPSEQQALIDENKGSVARNRAKLDLANTHYISSVNDDDPHLGLY